MCVALQAEVGREPPLLLSKLCVTASASRVLGALGALGGSTSALGQPCQPRERYSKTGRPKFETATNPCDKERLPAPPAPCSTGT